jgi:hypothetical protein
VSPFELHLPGALGAFPPFLFLQKPLHKNWIKQNGGSYFSASAMRHTHASAEIEHSLSRLNIYSGDVGSKQRQRQHTATRHTPS